MKRRKRLGGLSLVSVAALILATAPNAFAGGPDRDGERARPEQPKQDAPVSGATGYERSGMQDEDAETPGADAVETEADATAGETERPDLLMTRAGMAVRVGGGFMHFVDDDAQEFADAGGAWEARFTYGTRSLVGAEIAYIGSAQEIDALGLDSSAALLGTGGEAAVRLNIPAVRYIQPYGLAGIGLTNFSLVNEDFNTSSIDDSETVVHVPLAAGVGLGGGGFLFDVRATARPAFQDGLIEGQEDQVGETEEVDVAELDSWSVTASAGFEF